jgi:hypothetical protein
VKKYIPRIQEATDLIENGATGKELMVFLKEKMPDLSPDYFHNMSLEQRDQQLVSYQASIQKSYDEESEFLSKLQVQRDDKESSVTGVNKKIKESEERLKAYAQYLEELSKYTSEKYNWVPLPRINVAKVE